MGRGGHAWRYCTCTEPKAGSAKLRAKARYATFSCVALHEAQSSATNIVTGVAVVVHSACIYERLFIFSLRLHCSGSFTARL